MTAIKRRHLAGLAAGFTLAAAGTAHAAWPERPITLLVPWGAGGGTDAVARVIATLLEKDLGQPVSWSTAPAVRASSATRPSPVPRPTATRSA
jgi:tripartite-type tricarboxylate transporter receptor subunit TctC